MLHKLVKKIKQDVFKSLLIIGLFVLFFWLIANSKQETIKVDNTLLDNKTLHVFIQPGCPHCIKAEKFLSIITSNYKNINFVYHDLTKSKEQQLFFQYINKLKLDTKQLGTPTIIMNEKCIVGFESNETTGQEIKDLLNNVESTCKNDLITKKTITLPFFGKIDLLHTSLPLLTAILGLADGFNPCEMWVLIYLISIIAKTRDKKKTYLLVGSFVFSSAILYFLFMTAWLNAFLYIGYIRIMSLVVGIFALYFGITSVYEFIKEKGEITCKLGKNKTRTKAMSKIEKLANAELCFTTILGVVFLAFVVNSIEFLCSAAIPATYTYVLTSLNLSTIKYYGYILFYLCFFMLDDFIVYGAAIFALNKCSGTKYEKYSTIVGGVIMIIIGVMIVFFPNQLK